MSISSISNSSYYSTSSIYQKKYASETDDTTEAEEVLASLQQKNDMPPPPKPPEDGTNPEDAVYSAEDLTSYLDFVSEEYGIDIDATEFMEGKDSFTGSEIKSFLEENGLEFSAPPEPPKEPPMMNSTDEQMDIMAMMQSSSTVKAQSINISDYLTQDDEDEESEDLLSILEETKNASSSEATSSTSLEDLLLDAYADMYDDSTYQSSLFSV